MGGTVTPPWGAPGLARCTQVPWLSIPSWCFLTVQRLFLYRNLLPDLLLYWPGLCHLLTFWILLPFSFSSHPGMRFLVSQALTCSHQQRMLTLTLSEALPSWSHLQSSTFASSLRGQSPASPQLQKTMLRNWTSASPRTQAVPGWKRGQNGSFLLLPRLLEAVTHCPSFIGSLCT